MGEQPYPDWAARKANMEHAMIRTLLGAGTVIVNSFGDFKVQVVSSFPDLKVQKVNSFPDACGKWEFVKSFPDFTIEHFSGYMVSTGLVNVDVDVELIAH